MSMILLVGNVIQDIHRVLELLLKNNEHNNTCNQDIQCALPVITIMALYSNSWTWAHDVRLHNVGIQEPKSAQITTRAMSIILLAEMWSKIYTECSNCYKNNEHNNTCNQDYPMCPPGYHHNGFMATHELGHMMFGYTMLVFKNQRVLKLLQEQWA